jgi:hypothetical protein
VQTFFNLLVLARILSTINMFLMEQLATPLLILPVPVLYYIYIGRQATFHKTANIKSKLLNARRHWSAWKDSLSHWYHIGYIHWHWQNTFLGLGFGVKGPKLIHYHNDTRIYNAHLSSVNPFNMITHWPLPGFKPSSSHDGPAVFPRSVRPTRVAPEVIPDEWGSNKWP